MQVWKWGGASVLWGIHPKEEPDGWGGCDTAPRVTLQPGQSPAPTQQNSCVTGQDFVTRFWKSLQFLHAE